MCQTRLFFCLSLSISRKQYDKLIEISEKQMSKEKVVVNPDSYRSEKNKIKKKNWFRMNETTVHLRLKQYSLPNGSGLQNTSFSTLPSLIQTQPNANPFQRIQLTQIDTFHTHTLTHSHKYVHNLCSKQAISSSQTTHNFKWFENNFYRLYVYEMASK